MMKGVAPGAADDAGDALIVPFGETDAAYPSSAVAWLVIAVLFVVTLVSQLDRQIAALLVAPIKAEFHISDTAFSLLQGYAFALVYTLMGLPFGRLVDSTNRRNLIIAGVIVWCGMTALSAVANSYTTMVIARMGVGVGEAVLAPAAYSMIADYVAPARRGRAIAIYYLSLAIGQGVSLLAGGLILRIVPPAGAIMPLLGTLAPWRIAFLIAAAPGLAAIALLLLVREPARRGQGAAASPPPLGQVFAFVRENGRALCPILLCPTALAIVGYSAINWAVAYYSRVFAITPQRSGVLLGIIVAVTGVSGTLASGLLGDYLASRRVPAARLRVMQLALAITVPAAALWSIMPTSTLSMAVLSILLLASILGHSCAPVMVQEVVPNRMRGQIVAAYLLVAGLAGIGLAPTLVAVITDHLYANEQAVGKSLALVGGPVAVIGLIIALSSQRAYAKLAAAQ